jgi:hypothetical protein
MGNTYRSKDKSWAYICNLKGIIFVNVAPKLKTQTVNLYINSFFKIWSNNYVKYGLLCKIQQHWYQISPKAEIIDTITWQDFT